MPRIMIIEDDPSVLEVVEYAMKKAGFETTAAGEGKKALEIFEKECPDLIILDLNLPDMDGIDICKELRKSCMAPVIMLTSRAEEADKIIGLELGADDYVTKPFSPRELVARVRSHLRRNARIEKEDTEVVSFRKIVLDKSRHKATFQGKEIYLTMCEFNILLQMLKRPGTVFTRDMLIDAAYADNHFITDRSIDSHIKNIRKKLSDIDSNADIIETIYGVGYKIKETP